MTDTMVESATTHRQQDEAARALLDALHDGIQFNLPAVSWTVTYGGVLMAEIRKQDHFREDFRLWAEHLKAEVEDLSRNGRTVLRAITETGVPGRGRRVRIIVIAKVYE
ncbi:hypothetical protein ACH4PU_34070 [Streptomyces sp. NPDC021100]|uniref:hypothetical protein n=1 Tax=Streptomyces sp. NPDC021100 TaxID=3365114 RepID=UPI0037B55279